MNQPAAKPPVITLLHQLWQHLSRRRHFQLTVLFILTLANAFAEIISLGAVLPFMAAMASPEKVFAHPLVTEVAGYFDITDAQDLLAPLAALFVIAVIGAGAMRLLLLWAQTGVGYAAGADISTEIYRRTLYQPYQVHVARNSSDIINTIIGKTGATISFVLLPVLTLINSIVMIIFIFAALIFINPVIAISSVGGFGLCYVVIAKIVHVRLVASGRIANKESTHMHKAIQEGLGGIRDVLIDGTQSLYCEVYRRSDRALRHAQSKNHFIGNSPRYIMETIGMVIIAAMAYLLTGHGGLVTALPVLGALALGGQRLLPALQQGYNSWSSVVGNIAALEDTLELLEQSLPEEADLPPPSALPFTQNITLEHLSFSYSDSTPVILNIDQLVIPKGARVGFTGVTGSGKSTLIDIIMGLLVPSQGHMSVDGQIIDTSSRRAWQRNIAHVPQSIFLLDGTFTENIALGVLPDHADMARVKLAAKQAQIDDFIETQPKGYATAIGERGIRLSGGQRQRVGIARALYKDANLLVLDEATSALDSETELAVMTAVESLHKDLTILMVAHRTTTLAKCDFIVDLKSGKISISQKKS